MKKLVRKTITIPEEIYKQAKINAGYCNESFSAYIVNMLEVKILNKKKNKILKDPFKSMGVFSLHVKRLPSRDKLYEDHLKRKMGI